MKQAVVCFLLLLTGCAIDLDYGRSHPGISGLLKENGQPKSGMEVVYAEAEGENCKYPIGRSVTDTEGRFSIATGMKQKYVEPLPVDGCDFLGQICVAGYKPWIFIIRGMGNKTYHTGGPVLREPLRLFVQETRGECEPPEWLNVECELTREYEMCEWTL